MRRYILITVVVVTLITSIPAVADLQNVVVGGSIRIRGNYWTSGAGPDTVYGRNPLFQWPLTGSSRPLPNPLAGLRWAAQPGRLAVTSPVDWNETGSGIKFVEQRTKLNVRADFTDDVTAFIELDSYDTWGEDFRSNYVTGTDGRAVTGDDVEVYQAYIEAKDAFGIPLRLRVGRQELKFGSGWLIGTNDGGAVFRGLSFDGIRGTYATDQFSVDAFWAKLAENGTAEEDGDIDLYGLYASYLGIENVTLDAYWFWLRDAGSRADTYPGWFGNWVEDVLGVDDYDPTSVHTVGLRGAGTYGAFDFEAEAAYQFGDADSVGQTFAGAGLNSPYGDDDASYSTWAGNLQLGYTFDVTYTPRVFLGGAYFGGEDNRDLSFGEWLGAVACPFWSPEASVSFNRLFSDWQYGNFISAADHDCTNLWLAYAGVSAKPTEALTVVLSGAYVQSLADYRSTWPSYYLLGSRVNWFFPFTFIDQENDDDIVWELDLKGIYQYSKDLSFEAGYSHLFVLDGLGEGNFNLANGLAFDGGTAKEDADYVYFETKLSF